MTDVVIIDDSLEDREVLTDLALSAGASECKAFSNADDAIYFVEAEGADLIFVDFQLENEVGLAHIPRLRLIAPSAHIVLITGRDIQGLGGLVHSFGIDFLRKDRLLEFGQDDLRALISGAKAF